MTFLGVLMAVFSFLVWVCIRITIWVIGICIVLFLIAGLIAFLMRLGK